MIFSFDLVQTRSFQPVKSMIYPTRFWPGIQVSLRKQSVNSMRAGAAQKTPRRVWRAPHGVFAASPQRWSIRIHRFETLLHIPYSLDTAGFSVFCLPRSLPVRFAAANTALHCWSRYNRFLLPTQHRRTVHGPRSGLYCRAGSFLSSAAYTHRTSFRFLSLALSDCKAHSLHCKPASGETGR